MLFFIFKHGLFQWHLKYIKAKEHNRHNIPLRLPYRETSRQLSERLNFTIINGYGGPALQVKIRKHFFFETEH